MANKTFYKGEIGDRTYIRASTRSSYVSINDDPNYGVGFSSKPGPNPAVKIDVAEYSFLLGLKKARTDNNDPSSSWVLTADITAPEPAIVEPPPAAKARKMNHPAKGSPAAKAAGKNAAETRARKAAAEPVNGELADGLKAARKAEAKAEKPATVKERIWALISRPEGVTEREVCEALGGWKKAGATIGRAIKAADFEVRKEKDAGRTRYFRAEGK
jgi:hypothetical protein